MSESDMVMNKRKYGRSEFAVSEVGVGGHREGVETGGGVARNARFFCSAEERARVVGRAMELGVTYFDTTFGCEIASLGESLRIVGRRDEAFVSAMRVDFYANLIRDEAGPREFTRREVESRLGEFGFDRVEQFMLGAIEAGDPMANGRSALEDAFVELANLKAEGKIGLVGFSCHSPDYAARVLEAFPDFDAVMTPYNFANTAAEGALAAALDRTRAAWIAMKPLVWRVYGIPVTVLRRLAPTGDGAFDPRMPVASLALRFILQNPRVTTTVAAVNSRSEVEENASASGAGPLSADEVAELERYRAACDIDSHALLAMGGLLTENLRVRFMAIRHAEKALGLEPEGIDPSSDDAEERARAAASRVVDLLREGPARRALLQG